MELNTKNLFDFKYLINCTLDDKITWKTLKFFLNDLTPTLPKAKDLIRIMLEEFESFHKEVKQKDMSKESNKIEEFGHEAKDETAPENNSDLLEYANEFENVQKFDSDKILEQKDLTNEDADDTNEVGENTEVNEIVENVEMYKIAEGLENQDFVNDPDNIMTGKDNDERGIKQFKCTSCEKQFKSNFSFKRHCRRTQHIEGNQIKKDAADEKFKCKSCERQFKLKSSLRLHTKRVHLGTKLVCDYCGEKFYDLQKHMLVHTRETPYECQVCSKKFTKLERLKFHEGVHTFNKVKCKVCNKGLRSQAALTQHERIHTGEKPFLCSFCEKSFNSPHTLKVHEESHSDEKQYQCRTCGKLFKTKSGFKLHEKHHSTENPIKCSLCEKTFISKAGLKIHQTYKCPSRPDKTLIQIQKQEFECKPCNKKFKYESGMKYHQKVHEKITLTNLHSSFVKPFQCKICKKCLANKNSYKYHLKTHDSEREMSFKCKFCQKPFMSNEGRKKHEESHRKELKPNEENEMKIE